MLRGTEDLHDTIIVDNSPMGACIVLTSTLNTFDFLL